VGLGRVAFITLFERKILGLTQTRIGPNKLTFGGVLQPVADGVKLLFKEALLLAQRQILLFYFRPGLILILFLGVWTWILPWAGGYSTLKFSSLLLFAILGIGTYLIILVGWSSLRRFSKLGRIRGLLQGLSFEVAIILTFLTVIVCIKRFIFKRELFLSWEMIAIWLTLWILMRLIETNRAPFDLLEGERELIRGFNIEIGSTLFVYLFLSEYGMVLVMSISACFILTGRANIIALPVLGFMLLMRSCFPRIRYDLLITQIWQRILPLRLLLFIISLFSS